MDLNQGGEEWDRTRTRLAEEGGAGSDPNWGRAGSDLRRGEFGPEPVGVGPQLGGRGVGLDPRRGRGWVRPEGGGAESDTKGEGVEQGRTQSQGGGGGEEQGQT